MRSQLDSVRALVAAFAVVIASFLLAYAISTSGSLRIESDERELLFDSAPSLGHLTDARTEVRTAQLLLDGLVDHRPGVDAGRVEAARDRLDADLHGYLSLPLYPGEQPYWNAVSEAVDDFEAAQRDALGALEAGRTDEARAELRTRVRPIADRADDAIARATAFHRATIARIASDIAEARRRSREFSLLLILIATAVAVFAAALLKRVVRRTAVLQLERTHTAEVRADELEVFAARVAHDIANPLTAASTAIDAGLRNAEKPERMIRALQLSQRSLASARTIMLGLLDFARSGGKPEPGAVALLGETVRASLAELEPRATEARVELKLGAIPEEAVVCTPGVLASIVINLVGNAIKYMGDSVRREIEVRGRMVDGRVRIEVEDSGPGLPADVDPDSVFRMYVRGKGIKQPGLGLGLATVKRLVDAHGGRCGVRSRTGEGCLFWFEMPRAPQPALARVHQGVEERV